MWFSYSRNLLWSLILTISKATAITRSAAMISSFFNFASVYGTVACFVNTPVCLYKSCNFILKNSQDFSAMLKWLVSRCRFSLFGGIHSSARSFNRSTHYNHSLFFASISVSLLLHHIWLLERSHLNCQLAGLIKIFSFFYDFKKKQSDKLKQSRCSSGSWHLKTIYFLLKC